MSDDVILSRAEAKNLADFLRRRGIGEHYSLLKRFDPQSSSLRDEVAKAIALDTAAYSLPVPSDYSLADAVLAVVRKHYRERIADLRHQRGGDGWIVRYDDLTALFGDDEQIVRAAHQWDERGDTVGY